MKDRVLASMKSITIFEIVLTLVLAVALGVAFWGWTFIYDLAKPFLKLLVKYALLEVHSFNSNDDENSNPFIGVILKEGELIV